MAWIVVDNDASFLKITNQIEQSLTYKKPKNKKNIIIDQAWSKQILIKNYKMPNQTKWQSLNYFLVTYTFILDIFNKRLSKKVLWEQIRESTLTNSRKWSWSCSYNYYKSFSKIYPYKANTKTSIKQKLKIINLRKL